MKDASQYPVTFPYGATTPPYGTAAQPYHRGDDRAMPDGTPVLVNGVQIGLSGHTGEATGPHLHIGHFIGGKDVNPKGGTFTIPGAKVILLEINDAVDGNDVHIQAADGSQWVYLHLSRIDVKVGDTLEGSDMQQQIDELNTQLNKTNAALGAEQQARVEVETQLGDTNGFVDALTKRVAALEKGSGQPSDGTYELKKVN